MLRLLIFLPILFLFTYAKHLTFKFYRQPRPILPSMQTNFPEGGARIGEYYSTYEVGTPLQKFPLFLDTSRNRIWVRYNYCMLCYGSEYRFYPGLSSSFYYFSEEAFETYRCGNAMTNLKGNLGSDLFRADILPRISFNVIKTESGNVFERDVFSAGGFGVGIEAVSLEDGIVQRLLTDGAISEAVIGIQFHKTSATVTIGSEEESLKAYKASFTASTSIFGWRFDCETVKVTVGGNADVIHGAVVHLSSFTPYIAVPPNFYYKTLDPILRRQGLKCYIESELSLIRCNTDSTDLSLFPDLKFELSVTGFEHTIPVEELVEFYKAEMNFAIYKVQVKTYTGANDIVLGTPLLRTTYLTLRKEGKVVHASMTSIKSNEWIRILIICISVIGGILLIGGGIIIGVCCCRKKEKISMQRKGGKKSKKLVTQSEHKD